MSFRSEIHQGICAVGEDFIHCSLVGGDIRKVLRISDIDESTEAKNINIVFRPGIIRQ